MDLNVNDLLGLRPHPYIQYSEFVAFIFTLQMRINKGNFLILTGREPEHGFQKIRQYLHTALIAKQKLEDNIALRRKKYFTHCN